MPLLLDHISTLATAPAITGCLVILAAVTHAAYTAETTLDSYLLQQFAAWVSSETVRSLDHAAMQRQLVMVVANVVDLGRGGVKDVSEQLLHVLLHLQGNRSLDDYTQQQVAEVRARKRCSCMPSCDGLCLHNTACLGMT
jgi:hypothetical protein